MAKSLMKNWDYECAKGDLAGGGTSADTNADPATFIECTMVNLLRSIINGQNAQIQTMRELLDGNGWPEFDNCDRPLEGTSSVGGAEEVSEYVNMDVSRYVYDDAQHGRRRELQDQSDETPLWLIQLEEMASESTDGTGPSEYFRNDIREMRRPRERIWIPTNYFVSMSSFPSLFYHQPTSRLDLGRPQQRKMLTPGLQLRPQVSSKKPTSVMPLAPTRPARKYARSRRRWIYSPLILVGAIGRSVISYLFLFWLLLSASLYILD
jgi:hypothetical protein